MEMKRSQKEFVGATSSRTGYGVVLLHAVHTEGERERGREVAGKGRKGRKGRQAHSGSRQVPGGRTRRM